MAKSKKSRKGKVRPPRPRAAPQVPPVASAPARAPAARRPSPTAADRAPRAAKVDFSSEYHYVVSDLKRLGLTALAMFAVMTALALITG